MRAARYRRFGPPEVLEIEQIEPPSKTPGRARVAVRAAALNPKDALIRRGEMTWLTGSTLPRGCGYDIAGELLDEAPGLARGEAVFGMIQNHAGGALAEIVSMPFEQLAAAPKSLSMQEAASLPLAALTALQALRDVMKLKPGEAVWLNGASGGVGVYAVQIAVALGLEVTGICSGRNLELVRSLGASRCIDYTQEDLTERREAPNLFDIYGSLPWPKARRMLAPRGRFCTTIPRRGAVARELARRVGLHRAGLVIVKSKREDLETLARWVEQGKLKAVIDEVFELEQVAQAHLKLETRRARGKIVITL